MPSVKLIYVAFATLLCFASFAAADAPDAVSWLEARQQPDGSFGAWQEHATAAAALALRAWNSPNASLSLEYLRQAAENNESWFYGEWWGESDYPGVIAFSLAKARHAVNASLVAASLLPFQNSSSGGFKGYNYTDSGVDTSSALLGLSSLDVMPAANSTAAVAFLSSLQNADGSFNLTPSRSFDAIYSLGPNQDSETALALLALRSAGVAESDSRIQNALGFLRARTNESNFNGSVYAASLAAVAFSEFGDSAPLSSAVSFISSAQNADGGFADAARSSNASNALDTGFAAYALSLAPPAPSPSPSPSLSPSPSPFPTVSPSPTSPPSSATRSVYVRIYFPQGSGRADVSSQTDCGHAFECFAAVASVSCAYYAAVGPLYCAGVSQTCLVTAVDGVAASSASDYWRFEVNGVPAAVGVSCYQPASGNSLALRYVGAYSTPTPTPAPTAHASSPTLSPKPSPSPSSSPSPTTPPSRRKPSPSPALPPVGALNARASSPPVMQSATPLAPPAQAPAAQTGFVAAASGLGSATLLVISLALVAAFASLVLHFKRRSRNNEKK